MTYSYEDVVEMCVAGAQPIARTILASPRGEFPQLNTRSGNYTMEAGYLPGRGFRWAGFLNARMWLLHDLSGDALMGEAALELSRRIGYAVRGTQVDRGNTGFDVYHGICVGYEVSGEPELRELGLACAVAMEGLYCAPAQLYWQSVWFNATVSETPACLLPILWAKRHGVDAGDRILRHVHQTLDAGMVREDGSVQHRFLFDPVNGGITGADTSQGYARTSTWGRAQPWLMHSFASCLESADDTRIRDALGRAARWFVAHMPEDGILYYDYDDPRRGEIPRDSCGTLLGSVALRRCAALGIDVGDGLALADRSEAELLRNYIAPGGVVLHGSWGVGEGKSRWNTLFPLQDVMPYGNYWLAELLHRQMRPDSDVFSFAARV
jgi:unsaturated chondroitin disaccharide hydrolase